MLARAPVVDILYVGGTGLLSEKMDDADVSFNSSALVLDGTDDFVNLAAGEAAFDEIANNGFTPDMTVEAWFEVDQFDKTLQTIVSKGNA